MSENARPTTLGIVEAAALCRLHPNTLRAQAAAGEMPAAKLGRSWVFIEADLLAHMRGKYVEKAPCRSTNVKVRKSGGSTSAMLGGACVSHLERLIAQRRKKPTTLGR